MKPFRRLLLTAAIAVGLLGLAALLRAQYPRWLAQHWRGRLDTVPDAEARVLLGQIGELGEPGIRVLVEALGSRRESVARGAKQVLLERLDAWTTLSAEDVSPKLLTLADTLAEQVAQFGPTARRDAEDLATWLLRWHPLGSPAERARLIASCRKVLETTALDQNVLAGEQDSQRPGPLGREQPGEVTTLTGIPDRLPSDRSPPSENAIAELTRLPGGGLPIETFPPAVLPPDLLAQSGAGGAERRPLGPMAGKDATPGATSRWDSDHAGAEDRIAAPLGVAGLGAARPAHVSGPVGASVQPSGPVEDLAQLETLELMRRLRSGGGDATARVRAELARRGFTEVHLELARRLFDPDPEARIELARRLPGLQSVDAAPWLLWLSEDKDPEVRLVAVTLLATTSDPSLLERVEQIAARDTDPRVRRQAQRISQKPGVPRK